MVSTKTESELSLMRYAGKVAYETLNLMESLIHEGVTIHGRYCKNLQSRAC